MNLSVVWTMPVAALFVVGSFGMARADTSSVKLPAPW